MPENSQAEVYRDYLNYDFDSFSDFQDGLKEILDNYLSRLKDQDPNVTEIPLDDKNQLVQQAKCFFYCGKTGNILNLSDLHEWEQSNNETFQLHDGNTKAVQQGDAPPYSSNYQGLLNLIISGKEVPGIKKIPDTVLDGQGSESKAKQRQKPWER